MSNLVEIIVSAKNLAGPAFREARGDAESTGGAMTKFAAASVIAVGAIAVESVKMAAEFQSSTERLVTSAGESTGSIDQVRQGLLTMAGQVGYSAQQLSEGMYTVESAGYHAADGLGVMKAVAQGAKTENADLATVANAVTDVLKDFHKPASAAADVTSQLVTAVSHGKTTFQEFSGSMHNVLPLAGAMGLSFADVSGTLSEMTAHGVSADQASQNLQNAMIRLAAPTTKMTKALKEVGISSDDLKNSLSTQGLAGTMEMISQKALKFGAEGSPQYVEAMRKMMGTAPGLQAALMTTGENFKDTKAAIDDIGKSSKDSSGDVKGFAEIQGTFNQKMSEAKDAFGAVAIQLGTLLLPALTAIMGPMADFANFIASHKEAAIALAIILGTVLVAALVVLAVAAWAAVAPFIIMAAPILIIIAVIGVLALAVYEVINNWGAISGFFSGLWNGIVGIFTGAWNWIVGIVTGAWNGIKFFIEINVAAIKMILNWFGSLPGLFMGWINGAKDAIVRGFLAAVDWVAGLPGRILGALGNLGQLLWNAGKSILEGFLGGLKSMWDNITGFIGGIGNWIAANKGPISYDVQLLVPHGNAVMDGFLGGLQDGHKKVQSFISGVAPSLSGTVNANINASGSSSGGSSGGSGGGGGGGNVHFSGNVDSAFATAFMRLVREGQIQISV